MTRFNPLSIACACISASIVSAPAIGAVQTVSDASSVWSVTAAPSDPALATLSEEQLVDLLQETETTSWTQTQPVDRFWALSGIVNLGGGSVAVPVHSPAALELCRRGLRALPTLLSHLTDARATQLIYVVRESAAKNDSALGFGDEYDPRVRGTTNPLAAVNTGKRHSLNEEGTYTFKIGDLCYATLGQIVNRELRAVRCRAEDAMIFSGPRSSNPGDWFMTINSPVERPALAAAARADWSGLDARQHADSLQGDIHRPVRKLPLDTDALTRLLYYYPNTGIDAAVMLLRRKLDEPAAGTNAMPVLSDENSVGFWHQANFVRTLAPFHSDRLRAALLELFRQAATIADADLKAQPPGIWNPGKPSLGSDLALACAQQFLHEGHDDELKTFFSARITAVETANHSGNPGSEGIKFANNFQIQACRAFLVELENPTPPSDNRLAEVAASAPVAPVNVRLGPLSLRRNGSNLNITVEPIEPRLDQVFVGRMIIDTARDGVGATLWQGYVPMLAPVAVGSTSDEILGGLPKAAFVATLTRPASRAKTLKLLEGRIEMVVPDIDPDAVVIVEDIVTKTGSPLDSKALRASDVSITIKTEAGNVELSISDPHERFLNVEFRDSKGHSLHYNHNGWSHRSNRGSRTDAYRLGKEVPSGTQMVVWLKTDKSFLVVPLKAANLPLQEETDLH